jgi:predicted RNase H-like HicB family nuclease
MCGHSGGYFFNSDQARGVNPLGISLDEALANVRGPR